MLQKIGCSLGELKELFLVAVNFLRVYMSRVILRMRGIITSRVSVRPRAALATMPRRGTEEIASDVALTTLRTLVVTARVSPEEGLLIQIRVVMVNYEEGWRFGGEEDG